jgi:glycosyltransferase involved in cell wall biosynthesis
MLTKNRAWCLPRVLQAIEDNDYPSQRLKLVFVDDFSDDGSWEILEKWRSQHSELYHEILILREHTNIPEARNLCLDNAEGGYALFWDSDVIPPRKDFLSELVMNMENRTEIGAIGCSYVYENPGMIRKADKPPTSRTTHAVYLGFTLVRRKAADGTGRFNERMNVGEDTEYFIRMSEKTSFRILWGPQPVLHLRKSGAITTSPGGFRKLIRYTYKERAKGYFEQFDSLPKFLRFRVAYYLLLPISWVVLLVMSVLNLLNAWIVIGLMFCTLLPAFGSAVRNLGFRSGFITAVTFYIPTGIALSYGVVRESIRMRGGQAS